MEFYLLLYNKVSIPIPDHLIELVGGVGRGSNVWVSPEGCLMFSLQLRFSSGKGYIFHDVGN